LGLPLSITKPIVADFWPLVTKCERRLVNISSFLSQAGRLQMTNAVISALPTFTMCTYLLPKTVIKQIDKYRKHYLWMGSNPNSKKPPKAAWNMVCNSRENGGLGVHDLYILNESLLLKHLHKFFNKCDIPWVQLVWNTQYNAQTVPTNSRKGSFWWKDIFKLLVKFKNMATPTVGDGSSCLLWEDVWHGPALSSQYPELFSYVHSNQISVQLFILTEDKSDFFHLPLSVEAYDQYQLLLNDMESMHLSQNNDKWTYAWGSHLFMSSKAYSHLLGSVTVSLVYKWL
jgi:hypothetical protein